MDFLDPSVTVSCGVMLDDTHRRSKIWMKAVSLFSGPPPAIAPGGLTPTARTAAAAPPDACDPWCGAYLAKRPSAKIKRHIVPGRSASTTEVPRLFR